MKRSMKKLSMLLMMLCVTFATFAQPAAPDYEIRKGHWCCAHGDAPNVTILNVEEGHLREAILELLNGNEPHLNDCRNYKILRITNYKPDPDYSGDPTVTLNADDIAALNLLNNFSNFETIDLQDVKYLVDGKQTAFTFSNRYVKNLILPDNWTKDKVKKFDSSICTNLGSAISQGTNELDEPTMVVHIEKGNTLTEAVSHLFIDEITNTKLGEGINQHNHSMGKLRHLSVTGYPVARDLGNNDGNNNIFDENGHYVLIPEADETSSTTFAAVGGGTRQLQGEKQTCAFTDLVAKLITLDLSDAIIEDQYNEDLIVLNKTGIFGNALRTMELPTDAGFNTIPADFFSNQMGNFRQICIPGNIMYIKTRAFTMQSLDHIWTTGDDSNTVYDNGVYLKGDENPHTGVLPRTVDTSLDNIGEGSVLYGTYTLPAGLKLIESHAFKQDNSHVKDVYALSIEAPECHVDAFGPNFYHANNTISGQPVDGIITREAYSNNPANGTYVTMLHYPRECTTPDIQRYTDVTREYSVATADRDGKGATIYYPNQSEMMRAYTQGTYGYLWYAWDATRDPWTNSIETGTSGNFGEWTQDGQIAANQTWTNNENESPNKKDRSFYDVTDGNQLDQPGGLDPYYNTKWEGIQLYPKAGASGTGNTRIVPDLDSNGNYQYVEYDETSINTGKYIKKGTYTEANNGAFVRRYYPTENFATTSYSNGSEQYYSDAEGQNAVTPNVGTGYYYECGVKNVYSDAVNEPQKDADNNWITEYYTKNGDEYTLSPFMYFNDAVKDKIRYNPIEIEVPKFSSTQVPVDGVTTYYSDQNGETAVSPTLNKTYYHSPTTTVQTTYQSVNYLVNGVTKYYQKEGDEYIEAIPTFSNTAGGDVCYKNTDGEYVVCTNFKSGEGDWYVRYNWGSYQYLSVNENYPKVSLDGYYYYELTQEVTTYTATTEYDPSISSYYEDDYNGGYQLAQNLQFNNNYYYEDGIKTVTTYSSTDHWIPEVDTYYITYSEGNYEEYPDWRNGFPQNTYYYVAGTAPDYCLYEGKYDPTKTYYTDNNGENVASIISFDQAYYYNVLGYEYVEATESDAGKQHYGLDESYVADGTTLYAPDEIRIGDDYYSVKMKEVEIQASSRSNDYRGWHQFTLTAYATNSNKTFVPYRSYISDNDWWTICLAFDLTKADLIKLFGKNGSEASKDLPYLSKLTYVVRDVDGKNITLTFSPNLLEHKEVIAEEGQVHGVISDDAVALNDVVLHAGVPYLIRPNMAPEADGKYKRQFDIAFSENDNNAADNALYNRIKNSEKLNGYELKELIYKGIYTVPAYVINNGTGAESVGEQVTFTNYDTSSFTYTNSDEFRHNKQTMSASISKDFCYSFVGTFYVSRMPQYSYFLGWDSEKQRAAFWYCKASETGKFNWNNETGIICPNFITAQQSLEQRTENDFKDAEGLSTPAQWKIELKAGDDFNSAAVKNYTTNSQYGYKAPLWSDEATMIIHIDDDSIEQPTYIKGVYNMNGQYMGESMEGLSKGIYIQNGKKIYVK